MSRHDRFDARMAAIAAGSSFLAAAIIIVTLLMPPTPINLSEAGKSHNSNVVVIRDDFGGELAVYAKRWVALTQMGFMIAIDGECTSACTEILALVPRDRVCVTPHAAMGFHQASYGETGIRAEGPTRALYNSYPKEVREF